MPETIIKEAETEEIVAVSNGIYARYIKLPMDFILSLCAVIVLSPILLVLTVIGAIVMKGNPFFVQERPGKIDPKTGKAKIFKLIKFRTMTCEKDKNGNPLPDDKRLTPYGNCLRKCSLDELLELINILKGDMSIVGPRPLLPEYLRYYTEQERHRHDVRPGLTGLAQINGRNAIDWDTKLAFDVEYISNISFLFDVKIILHTVYKVLKRNDVLVGKEFKAGKFIEQRKERQKELLIQNEANFK